MGVGSAFLFCFIEREMGEKRVNRKIRRIWEELQEGKCSTSIV